MEYTRCTSNMRVPSREEVSKVHMPILRCSFPRLLHPEYETVREKSEDWIVAVAQPPSAAAHRFLLDCLLPLLLCQNIPNSASVQRLVHVTKMIAWLTIADDDDDHPSALGSDYASTACRADVVMSILSHLHHDDAPLSLQLLDSSSFTSRMKAQMKALAELWEEIRQEMPPGLQARFISTMADYFDGVKAQASFRKANRLPDLEGYIEIRRQASFTLPAFVLIEYALGVELKEATYMDSLITELRNAAMDFICMCNDIISCQIEISVGDYFNLPCILYNLASANSTLCPNDTFASSHIFSDKLVVESLPYMTFQGALDYAAQMVYDLDKQCSSLISTIQLSTSTLHVDPSLQAYVASLSSSMSGCLAWFLESARYCQISTRSELYQVNTL